MNPPRKGSIRHHNSLRASTLMDEGVGRTNTIPIRLSLGKKASLHSEDSSSKKLGKSYQHIRNESSFQAPNSTTNLPQKVSYFQLTPRDPLPQHHDENDRKLTELQMRIDQLQRLLSNHDNRIKVLQSHGHMPMSGRLNTPKQEINSIVHKAIQERQSVANSTIIALQTKIQSLAFEIKNIFIKPEFDRKVESCIISLRRDWGKSIESVEGQLLKQLKSQSDKIYQHFQREIEKTEARVKNGHPQREKFNPLISRFKSFFQNSNLRLKSTSLIALVDISCQNPEKEFSLERQTKVYKVDEEGYLLDEENRYILDHQNRQIQLTTQHLRALEQANFIR